jgi:hypothetical protein
MYPLESCIVFHRSTQIDTLRVEFFASDPVYMHASVFAPQAYISQTSGRRATSIPAQAMIHHSAALRSLREKLSISGSEDNISDPTILVVLYLALHAHFANNNKTAKHHMKGVSKIVDMRGGLNAFSYNTKMIIELLK